MIRQSQLLFGILILFSLSWSSMAFAQKPFDVERVSELQFELSNSAVRSFPIQIEENDRLKVTSKVVASTNFMVLTPLGTVIYEAVLGRKAPLIWEKTFSEAGLYQVVFEDVSWLKQNSITAQIQLNRTGFCFGSCGGELKSILNPREDTIVTSGNFKASYANEKSYPVSVQKGDTVSLSLKAHSGVIPEFGITNSFGEVLHYKEISKEALQLEIIALNDGQFTLTFLPPAFIDKVKRFIPGKIQIELKRVSPLRYNTGPTAEVVEEKEQTMNQYDTVAEVYLDTIIYLSAIRDITKRSKAEVNIRFKNAEELANFGILYGSGPEFVQQVNQLDDIKKQSNSDVVSAFCNGNYNPKLPSQSQSVGFNFSDDIMAGEKVGSHFVKVEYFSSTSTINIINKSQILAQEVYIKVVGFRLVEL